ncbi:MAG TPA: hypothetical protein VK141_09905 [Nitrosomonas sp.]|nr:hypothetical protein [Nitrosomonas sp.]
MSGQTSEWLNFKKDFRRYEQFSKAANGRWFLYMLRQPGMHAVAIFRFGTWIKKNRLFIRVLLYPIYLILNRRMRARWGIEIQMGARIGPGMLIHHYGGIFIVNSAVIGENFSITHDITIGISGRDEKRQTPVIGNNVYLGPGVKIIGGVRVGTNVTIGPNTLVMRDIPPNSVVTPQAPRVVQLSALNFSLGDTGVNDFV